jgi:hypothetical protein
MRPGVVVLELAYRKRRPVIQGSTTLVEDPQIRSI